jgi:hypothetical protein
LVVPKQIGTEPITKTIETKNQPVLEVCNSDNVIIDPSCNGNYKKAGFICETWKSSISDLKKDSPVIFRGRIINTDNERKLNHILKKSYAKRIYHLGICSDIRNCSKDKSQCLRCDFMVPDVDDLGYYKEELQDWTEKMDTAKKIGNIPFVELCQDWIDSYVIVINKVLDALSDENFETEASS